MSYLKLVTPSMKNYASASVIPFQCFGLESWLRVISDEPSSTPDSVQAALSNVLSDTPKVIPIETALGAPDDAEHMGLYVLSNPSGHLGASVILNPLSIGLLRDILHADDITLIPSSVHELLAVRTGFLGSHELADLTRMIQEINASEVAQKDQLDDQPWRLHNGIITRCCHQEAEVSAPASAYAVAKV